MTPTILLLQSGAVAVSLLGHLVIARGGTFGTGETGFGEGLTFLSIALVYAWWLAPVAAGISGIRGAFLALVVLDVLWVLLSQGVAGFIFCAIPCTAAAPFGEIARTGSVVFGAAAAWTAWQAYRASAGPTQLAPAVTAIVLIVISSAMQAANMTPPAP